MMRGVAVRRERKLIIAALAGMTLLAGCDGSAGSQRHLGDTIRIGLNLESSGAHRSYGDAALKGAQTAVNMVNQAGGINGKQIEVVAVDNGSSPGRATALSTQLMTQNRALAVLGPITEPLFTTTTSIADKQQIVSVASLACGRDALMRTAEAVHEYAFRSCLGHDQHGAAMARFAATELSAKTAMIVRLSDSWAADYSDAFIGEFEAQGGKVVIRETFGWEETDFSRYVTGLRATPADVIYLAGPATEAGHVIRTLRDAGLNQPVLGSDELASPALAEVAGNWTLTAVYLTAAFSPLDTGNPRTQQFIDAYRADWNGAEPYQHEALAHDAALLIMDAITRADEPTGVAVQKAMAATSNLEGATGRFSIGPNHQVIKDALVVELLEGSPVSVTHVAP